MEVVECVLIGEQGRGGFRKGLFAAGEREGWDFPGLVFYDGTKG